MARTQGAVCPHDCPDACVLRVEVDGRRLVAVEGEPGHPVTAGFVCPKVRAYAERLHSRDRLLHPLLRTGPRGTGNFRAIGWKEALDRIAERFAAIAAHEGAEAILPCFGSGTTGLIQMYVAGLRFFTALGTALPERRICSEAGKEGFRYTTGATYGADPEGADRARLVILWGANPVATNLHLVPILKRARAAGALVVLIDPRRTASAALADHHLRITPGTDGLLALGMMRVIVEEGLHEREAVAASTVGLEPLCRRLATYPLSRVAAETGIAEPDMRELARLYATTRPALIRIGVGLQHHTNGGMAVRAISCLPALAGHWGVPGGGALYNNNGLFPLSKERLLGELPAGRRRVNLTRLGEALTAAEPRFAALYVYNGNPLLSLPDQNRVRAGLARPDLFVVVHEQFLTDTARLADIVLPATMQLEHYDLHTSTFHYYLAENRPCLPPPGSCRSNHEVFRLLAARLGVPGLEESAEEIARAALASADPLLAGVAAELAERGFARLRTPTVPFVPFAGGRFPTPSGKVELYSEKMAQEGLDPLPVYHPPVESREGSPVLYRRYPLRFLTPSARHFLNSSFANLARHRAREGGRPRLVINPADATPRGIRGGDLVRVANDRGSCLLVAAVSEEVGPGTVATTTMWWADHSPGETTPAATTPAYLADLGGGSAFHTNLVEVEALRGSTQGST